MHTAEQGLGTHNQLKPKVPTGLNLGRVARDQRLVTVLSAFEALAPGGRLILSSVSDPNHLLRGLQFAQPGGFDWNVLTETSNRSRIEIRRRGTAALRNVTEYLEGDHQRLNSMLADITVAVGAGVLTKARKRFAEFKHGLCRHIEVEECVLFPLVEKAYGLAIGPKTVMGSEHVEIRRLTDRVATSLESECIDICTQTVYELTEVLSRHDMKEERILYPMADKAIGDERHRHDLVNRMQAL